MNFIDQVYLVLIYVGSELSKNVHTLMGAVLAVTISYLKTHKEKREQNWSENLLCGIFAGIALTGLSLIQYAITSTFNVPEGVTVPTTFVVGVVSGAIAWKGTEGTVRFLKSIRGVKHNESTESSNSNGGSQ
jgi:hypothetical protein